MEKVSVIIVVFNNAATIRESVTSVLKQKYEPKELVVIDGKSNDGTLELLQEFGAEIDYLLSEKDNGIYDAMNKGIRAATGDWLYFLGSDDIIYDDNTLLNIFGREEAIEKADFIYGNIRLRSNNRQLGGSRNYQELVERNIPHQAIFYRKAVFEKTGLYNPGYRVLADWDMNLRVFRDESLQKHYINCDVSLFNDKGGASNYIIDSRFFSEQLALFTREGKDCLPAYLLQPFYFYTGVVLFFRDKKLKGLQQCLRACFKGRRKLFFLTLFCRFCFYFAGIGKKIKIV